MSRTKRNPLRIVRIGAALLIFALLLAEFCSFGAFLPQWMRIVPHVQFVPAVLAGSVVIVVLLALMTLVFGRVYCSVICPLGIYQDVVIRLRRQLLPKRKRRVGEFRYSAGKKWLRIGSLACFVVLFVLGLAGIMSMSIPSLLDPYAIFGRAVGQFVAPAAHSAVGMAASAAAEHDVFFISEQPPVSALTLVVAIVAAVQVLIVTVMAFAAGRAYCNSVCPVGSVLGYLSRFAWLRPVIDTSKCNGCGACGRHCKAQCIDTKNHEIDLSRCVACMDCIGNCTQSAISYRRRQKKIETVGADSGRRAFVVAAAMASASTAMAVKPKLAPVRDKQPRKGLGRPVPAGAVSIENFNSHCVACQLCVSACPSSVLRPSLEPASFMQPQMQFTDGFCRPECTECSKVCPAGAIISIEPEQKVAVKIGTARVFVDACISAAYGQSCGNCSRHCPAGAIVMRSNDSGHLQPFVDADLCIGCGECEFVCPVGVASVSSAKSAAICVEGLQNHRYI